MLLFILACAEPEVPTCESEDAACFQGFFRTLLGSDLDGMRLCTPELDLDCVETDGDGAFSLPGLPLDTNVVVTADHDDHPPVVFAQTTAMDWYDWYKVGVPTAVMDQNASALEVELDPDKGHVLFLVWEGLNLDGVDTPTVEGVVVDGASGQPFYGNALGLADPDRTATSSAGSGGFLNVQPGSLALEVQGPNGPCGLETMFHFPAVDGVISVPILAGRTTAIDVQCP